jgi:hypothetical protein
MASVELLDIMNITWECQSCETDFDTEAPIYSNLSGDYVLFSCPECNHQYEIELEQHEGIKN